MNELHASIEVLAAAEAVFAAMIDIRARARDLDAFQRVDVFDESDHGFMATMHEHYGGRDVVITSRFRCERPSWLSYEHVDGPYGRNQGTFTIEDRGTSCTLQQTHRTEQDVSEGTALREEWLTLIRQQLEAIRRAAESTGVEA